MKTDFVHLHNHTEYSLLDGAMKIANLTKRAAKYKMGALAITDHGNLFGAIEFYKACYELGINPIIGAEVYVAVGSRKDRTSIRDISESSFHLTLLCKNYTGYQNLIKLVSMAYLEGFYYRPRVDKELLAQYHKGLIGLSGCLKGEINYYLLRDEIEKAREVLGTYQDIFGAEDFYLELMRLGIPDSERSVAGLLELSAEMGAKVVATNDCHYLDAGDVKAHDALVCIQTGKKINESKRLKFESTEVYFKSPEVMASLFADIPTAISNCREIAEKCHLVLDVDSKKFYLPAFPIPGSLDAPSLSAIEYLSKLSHQGLKERYPKLTPEIEARLQYELTVIARMGFAGYFLIVKDIIDYARNNNIPIGPGRGSAVSSLVLYTLGITDIDPLKYGLLFERFMNPERVTLPDIDIDFADNRRAEIIEYIRTKYGKDSVAQIITFGTMQSRAVVRDVGRVLDIPYAEVDQIAKLIPFGTEINKALKTTKELKDLIESSPKYKELLEIAEKLEGLARHASIHASGVVITPKPLMEFVPLYKTADDEICTQYDMDALADIGLLKMDILGLKTLSVIDKTIKICARQGKVIDKKSIPLDDAKTFELLKRAETTGLFQVESQGMRDILRKSKPDKLEDLCAVIALYRPGPMANIDEFVNRKLGRSEIKYFDSSVEPILKETYGIMVYQEQVMQIASTIAGFTPSQYDRLRKAMGKKIAEEMEAMRETFIEGAIKRGFSQEQAEKIFDEIAPFAGYGFNKSHSMGYAQLSYLTAYLKANYPVEFMTALLTSEISDSDKLNFLIKDLRKSGIAILPPDINYSNFEFTIEQNKIRYGLGGIKHLGQKVCEAIAEERTKGPYRSFRDFIKRTRRVINRKAYEMLIKAGALDSIDKDRSALLNKLEDELEKASSERLQYLERQNSLFEPLTVDHSRPIAGEQTRPINQIPSVEFLTYEKEAFGFYFSCHPLDNFELELKVLGLVPLNRIDSYVQKIKTLPAGAVESNTPFSDIIHIGGVVLNRSVKKDRKGQDYAIFNLEDFTGITEIIVFSDAYNRCRQFLRADMPVIVRGRISPRDELKTQIEAKDIIPFTEWQNYFNDLMITIKSEDYCREKFTPIKNILEKHTGPNRVFLKIINPDKTYSLQYRIDPGVKISKQLILDLTEIIDISAIKIFRQINRTIG